MDQNKVNAIKNSILSFVLGDVVGLSVVSEYNELLKEKLQNGIEALSNCERNSNIPFGTWSDDTSMTLCTMQSIIDKNNIDLEDITQKFCSWFQNGYMTPFDKAFDIGQTTYISIKNFLNNAKEGILKGQTNIKSNGNGSLMRILPTILYCKFYNLNFETIKSVSELTHAHPISIFGCYVYTKIINQILDGSTKKEIRMYLGEMYHDNVPDFLKLKWFNDIELKYYDAVLNCDFKTIYSDGYIVDTLKVAIWGFLNSESVEECILKIAQTGGDTDTNCAIGASFAGLYYGLRNQKIPENLINKIIKKDMILNIIDDFVKTLSSFDENII